MAVDKNTYLLQTTKSNAIFKSKIKNKIVIHYTVLQVFGPVFYLCFGYGNTYN